MTDQLMQTKCFCNLLAIEKGLDPVGSAGNFRDAVIIEHPLPWKYTYAEMGLAQEVLDLLDLWMQEYHEIGVYGHRPLLIAPDPDYSQEGFRRVIFFTRPNGLFAQFDKVEYLVPLEKMGKLIWSWYQAVDKLTQFEVYRQVDSDNLRDILVCTHGSVDVACAKFGYPIYKHLRDNKATEKLRVWRVSHFGGHLYAPTLMDMPKGDYWAYVDDAIGDQIIEQAGTIQNLLDFYRGWAGLEMGFMQAMERACLMIEGWKWQAYKKSGEILAIDSGDDPQWAEIRINYCTPQDLMASFQARVEIDHVITSTSTSNANHDYPYPQYSVIDLKRG